MMGRKLINDARDRLVQANSLREYIPKNHLLVRIDDAIDFSFIYDEVDGLYAEYGSDSIDPVVVFKMLLIKYIYNIVSERVLVEEIKYNIAYRYFIGYALDESIPDRTVLTRMRDRWGEGVFRNIFNKIVQMCIDVNLVDGKSVSIDSTLVKAKGPTEIDKLYSNKKKMEYLNQVNETNEIISIEGLQKVKKKTINNKTKAEKNLYPPNLNPYSISNLNSTMFKPENTDDNLQVLKHDPDARFTRKSFVGYKVHRIVDHKYGVVLSDIATPGNVPDPNVVPDMIRDFKQKFKMQPENVSMDSGYKEQYMLNFVAQLGYDIYLPVYKNANVKNKDMFGPDKFIYSKERNVLICPEGKELKLKRYRSEKGIYEFKANAKDCNSCSKKHKCTSSNKGRTSAITVHEELMQELSVKRKTRKYKDFMRKRQIYSEGSFAEAKRFHGMDEACFRGLEKMNIQALITSIIQNIKKFIKYAPISKTGKGNMTKEREVKAIIALSSQYYTNVVLYISIKRINMNF